MLGVEVRGVQPPQGNLLAVLPSANNPETQAALAAFKRLVTSGAKSDLKSETIRNREVTYLAGNPPVQVAWWMEGDHFVFHLGTDKPDEVIARIDGSKGETGNLLAHPLYQQVNGFKTYTTSFDGFVDVRKCVGLLQKAVPDAAPFVETLGLNSLKSIRIHMGYQERMNRSTYIVDLDGPRKGLLQVLMPEAPFDLGQLPPVPNDVTSVSVMQLDWGAAYDLAKGLVVQAAKLSSPEGPKEVEKYFHGADEVLGINIRQDLLGSLGTQMAFYESPSEGIFFQGLVVLIAVKDEAKLRTVLTKMCRQLGEAANVPVEVEKHTYLGQEIQTVKVTTPGFFPRPSFLFHKGWIAISLYPQPLKGLVLRGQNRLPVWKPSPESAQCLQKELASGAKLLGFSTSDPRPTLKTLMSLAPAAGGFVASLGDYGFDPFLIPNGQVVTQPLFPNTHLTLQEGNSVRYESYTSINIPSLFNAEGIATWAPALVAMSSFAWLGVRAERTFEVPAQPAIPEGKRVPPTAVPERAQPGQLVKPTGSTRKGAAAPTRPGPPPQ
jgi:hypothetical protein